MPDTQLPLRTLRTTFWLAALVGVMALALGRRDVALGVGVGAAVGLFSLWSLMVIVPRVFAPGRTAPKLAFGMLALLKLPIYALVLNWAVTQPYISSFAVFAGAGMVPLVLVLKTLGQKYARDETTPGQETTRRAAGT